MAQFGEMLHRDPFEARKDLGQPRNNLRGINRLRHGMIEVVSLDGMHQARGSPDCGMKETSAMSPGGGLGVPAMCEALVDPNNRSRHRVRPPPALSGRRQYQGIFTGLYPTEDRADAASVSN
jgi:hypothetical protein